MRTGKLKIKQYKTRRSRRGFMILILLMILGISVFYFYQRGDLSLPLPLPPAPTLSPEEAQADERTLTLPGQSWFALQLGVFEQESSARDLANAYHSRGAGGYIDARDHFRVLAAAYQSRADAQAVQQQLRTLHQVDAYLFELQIPEITLRLTGQKAQLTALSDAYDALHQAALHLSDLSQSLDQRTAAQTDVRAALQSQKNTVISLEKRIRALFGESPHQAVRPILSTLEELSQALDRALSAQTETRLGAEIKYCQLLCIVHLAEYSGKLSAGQF